MGLIRRAGMSCNSTYRLRYWNFFWFYEICFWCIQLQQYLPFTVLKPQIYKKIIVNNPLETLQQYLPFTVLKRFRSCIFIIIINSCNSTYRLRYWNYLPLFFPLCSWKESCNSTYRLRYWNVSPCGSSKWSLCTLQQYLPFTVLKRPDKWEYIITTD